MSEGEDEEEPPRKKQKSRNYRKKYSESFDSDEEELSPVKTSSKKKAIPQQRKKRSQLLEEGSEEGEMKKPSHRTPAQLKKNDPYEDSEFEEINASTYDGELLDIEQQEDDQSVMEANKSYLKKALSGKSRGIIKK